MSEWRPKPATWLLMGDGQDESGQAWWRKDLRGITILLMLYTLQGIPMGLVGSIPLLLQTRGVGYAGQAVFSFVRWPYSLKVCKSRHFAARAPGRARADSACAPSSSGRPSSTLCTVRRSDAAAPG